ARGVAGAARAARLLRIPPAPFPDARGPAILARRSSGPGRARADQASRGAGARDPLRAREPFLGRGAGRGGDRRPRGGRAAAGRPRRAPGGDRATARPGRAAEGDRGGALAAALPARGVPARARAEEAGFLSLQSSPRSPNSFIFICRLLREIFSSLAVRVTFPFV